MIAEMDKRFRTTMAILGKEITSYALISPRIAHTMTNTRQIILIIFNLFFSSITNEFRFICQTKLSISQDCNDVSLESALMKLDSPSGVEVEIKVRG